jgi:hypothetical protein
MTVNMELVAIKYNYSKENKENLEEIRMIDRPNLWNLIKCDGLDIKN